MKKALVFFKDILAGYLSDNYNYFEFKYDKDYLTHGFPISVTLPLRAEPFISKDFFPFFDGLIVEGWLLKTIEDNWKINPNDRMSLLLLVGEDTIGAVSIKEVANDGK